MVAAIAMQSGVFEGTPEALVFTHSVKLHSSGMYATAGRLVALSLCQGGRGLHCMAEAVYRYMCGLDIADSQITVDLIADADVRARIQSVRNLNCFSYIW